MTDEIDTYKKAGLFKNPSKKLLKILDLTSSESILINLKVVPFRAILKNNKEEPTASNIILTTGKLIFVSNGWVMKYNETVSYNEIQDILVTKKELHKAEVPVIIIKTENDTYEIFFFEISLKRIFKKINGIIDCIRKRNPNIDIRIDLKEESYFKEIKEIFSTEIKFN
jgi:hypothetical protein